MNNLENVAKPLGEIVKIMLVQCLDNFHLALELYSEDVLAKRLNSFKKNVALSRLRTVLLKLHSSAKNRKSDESQKVLELCTQFLKNGKPITYEQMVEASLVLDDYLYNDLGLTKIDTREVYDRTMVENENRFE